MRNAELKIDRKFNKRKSHTDKRGKIYKKVEKISTKLSQ